jgi:hypothetical protein
MEIGIAVVASVAERIVSPIVNAVRDFALEKTRTAYTMNPTLRRILVSILTDKRAVQMSSLMSVDFAQAIENLSNANALLGDGKSDILEKDVNSFHHSSSMMMNHYLSLAEQAAIRAYHFAKTCKMDHQFECARLLVECSSLYAIQQELSSEEIKRRLNRHANLVQDIMEREYGKASLEKTKIWRQEKRNVKSRIAILESKRNAIYEEWKNHFIKMKVFEKRSWMRYLFSTKLRLEYYKLHDVAYSTIIQIETLDKRIKKLRKELTKLVKSLSLGSRIEKQLTFNEGVFQKLTQLFPFSIK